MDILNIIGHLQEKRKSKKIIPSYVPEAELINTIHAEARKELNELYLSGKIGVAKTLNSKAIYIKE